MTREDDRNNKKIEQSWYMQAYPFSTNKAYWEYNPLDTKKKMKRFWYTDYKKREECNPTELDQSCLLRGDNVIINTKQELLDICSWCANIEKCTEWIKQLRAGLFSNLNNGKTTNPQNESWK